MLPPAMIAESRTVPRFRWRCRPCPGGRLGSATRGQVGPGYGSGVWPASDVLPSASPLVRCPSLCVVRPFERLQTEAWRGQGIQEGMDAVQVW